MKQSLHLLYRLSLLLGIDPRRTFHLIAGLPFYVRDLRTLRNQRACSGEHFPFGTFYPCLDDRFTKSGSATGHYFHQDLLVARRIFENAPKIHVDVASRIDGFVAHVASFRPIKVIDIRPAPQTIPNVRFIQADLMQPLSEELISCCDSLSCLHALEHFGLGRYGDPVNYEGHLVGLSNLHSMLQKGGKFYFSVPIGPQRIEFNAHRVFSVSYLVSCFANKYHIDRFSFVDDNGDLHEDFPVEHSDSTNNFGCRSGCGIFELTKL